MAEYGVRGKEAHDAGHVAAMRCHGMTNVLTFDIADFGRYESLLQVWTPRQLIEDRTATTDPPKRP